MKYISEREYNARLKQIQKDNLAKQRMRELRDERYKGKPKRRLPSTSKLILVGMILLCIEIVIFCEYAMMKLYDASSLYVLIGIPAALAPIIWGYYSKAKAENTEGGIRYMTVMEELRQHAEEDAPVQEPPDGSGSDESVG